MTHPTPGQRHHILVEHYAAPSLLVDGELDVVHVSEHAGTYLRIAGGEPTRQLLRLIDPSLREPLASAIEAARRPGADHDARPAGFERGTLSRSLELRVRTVDAPELGRGALLVVFVEPDPERASRDELAALRDADRRKDEFLATLSHELRNPLATLQVALEVARMTGDDPFQRTQSLGIMERQVSMLTTLVDELLDLSRIAHGMIDLERTPVGIAYVLEGAIAMTRGLLTGARHELHVELPDTPIMLDGDGRRLVQVFANVLSNAARYTPSGGRITVGVVPSADTVAVRVADTGEGITAELLPHIFDMFVQRREHGRSQGGLGIGLNLAQRLVELHGGTITAASDGPGRGSAFTVVLPRGERAGT